MPVRSPAHSRASGAPGCCERSGRGKRRLRRPDNLARCGAVRIEGSGSVLVRSPVHEL
ncbi:hypothetical protein [Paenibacillus sp. TY11]|uniref:hypothetical protein n=1 Tax=Paenibacillus sp. TY11 TaxID=3448633 RepID=UPI004039EF87